MTHTDAQTILFVGLGNPGPHYAMTRHNLGYLVVQALAQRYEWVLKDDRRFNAKVAKGKIENKNVHLVLPLTFMNLSGTAVRRYVDYYKIPLKSVVVITDDVSLPFTQLRLRTMGSAGGHNGLKSIEASLGTTRYMRLRMGIGHPGEKLLANFVLEPFSPAEQQELPPFIDRGLEVLQLLLKESISRVMNRVNTGPVPKQQEVKPKDLTKPPLIGRGE